MIYKSTHQPTPQERMGEYQGKRINVPELNPAYTNIFTKRFHSDFNSLFGESK